MIWCWALWRDILIPPNLHSETDQSKERLFLPKNSCLSFVEFQAFFRRRELGRETRDAPSPLALMGFAGLGIRRESERAREREGDICCVSETGKVIRTHDRGCNESVFLLQCIVLTLSSDLFLLSLARHTCCASHVSISLSSRFSLPLSPSLHQCSTSRSSEIVA